LGVEFIPPIGAGADFPGAAFHPRTRGKFFNPLDKRVRAWDIVERKIIAQSFMGNAARNIGVLENRFELGGKVEIAVKNSVIERLDTQPVANNHQTIFPLAPESGGEHTAESLEACGVPLGEGAQRHFGIAVRLEAMAQGL
jgi:hypothetical protein